MRTISLTQGQVALVDDEDFSVLSRYSWCAQKPKDVFYAQTRLPKTKVVYMHSFLIPDANYVDHKDGNGLNNQRLNLRSCTMSQNLANRHMTKTNTSGYKGVVWFERDKKWASQIMVDYRKRHLGYFESKIDAARAYDRAAVEYLVSSPV
jgi:hypothetical protein